MYMCKQVGLDNDAMDDMTVGACLDYIDNYVARQDPKNQKNKTSARKASQSDFDRF